MLRHGPPRVSDPRSADRSGGPVQAVSRDPPAHGRTARIFATALLAILLADCRSLENRLLPESAIPELRELAEVYRRQPRSTVFETAADPVFGPLQVAVHEVGAGGHDEVLVFVHGVLSDHRTWRYVAGALADRHDVWLVDLPGCGASDAPAVDRLAADGYSPDWLARRLLEVLRARLATRPGPARVTLIGHSLGGGVLLRALGSEDLRRDFADVLAHVERAALLAPLEFGYGKADPTFVAIARTTDLEMLLGAASGLVRRATAESIYYGGVDASRVASEGVEELYEILMDPPRRRAAQAMLLRAVPFDDDGRMRWESARELVDDYAHVDVPVLVLWGENDETLPSQSGDRLAHDLPDAWLRILRDCKHGLPTEEPVLCIDQLRRFLAGEHLGWPRFARLDRPAPPGRDNPQEERVLKQVQREGVSRGRVESAAAAPSSVTVLRGRDLQRSGARYLSDALRLVPGTEVVRVSSTESGVGFRGYADVATAAQGTLGLVDGRQVQNPYLGNVLWDQLPVHPEDVEQIEVIRGPGSFLHGPNAMHGVVSVETRSPLDYADGTVLTDLGVGSYGSARLGGTVIRRTEESGFKTSVQWDDLGSFDAPVVSGESAERDQLSFDVGYEARLGGDPRRVLSLQGGIAAQEFDLLLPSLEGLPPARLATAAHDSYAQARYRHGDPRRTLLEIRASWSGFDSDSVPTAFYQPFELRTDTVDLEVQGLWNGDVHAVTAGVGYRLSAFDTGSFDVSPGRQDVHQGWVFAQDELRVEDGLTFTLGARLDQHSVTAASLSPRAAAVLRLLEGHYLRASAGRGFRNPSLRELWFDMPITGAPGTPLPVRVEGNLDLDPERLTSYELGWVGSFGPVVEVAPGALPGADGEAHRFEVGVTGFYNRVDDLIDFERDPDVQDEVVVRPRNQPGEEALGCEVEGRYVFSDWFSSFGNYAFSRRQTRGAAGGRNEQAPESKVNLGATFSGERIEATVWTHYYDATELFGQRVGSYLLVNGSLSYRFDLEAGASGRLYVRAFNLLDDDHREHPEGDSYGLLLTTGVQFTW